MKIAMILAIAGLCSIAAAQSGEDNSGTFNVVPFQFDPAGSQLVAAEWRSGIGCATSASIAAYPSTTPTTTYQEPGCPTGDDRDRRVEGLLLAKTGPTANNASAGARITGVRGITLTELGYDIRKPDAFLDPRGSHCGAGAPRFNVVTEDNVTHFVGCASPPPLQTSAGFWIRLRWTPAQAFPPITSPVRSISIVFDEGQDTAPDNFGLAVLDNIDVNGNLVGRGPRGSEAK